MLGTERLGNGFADASFFSHFVSSFGVVSTKVPHLTAGAGSCVGVGAVRVSFFGQRAARAAFKFSRACATFAGDLLRPRAAAAALLASSVIVAPYYPALLFRVANVRKGVWNVRKGFSNARYSA
jgi:hypothetical protein